MPLLRSLLLVSAFVTSISVTEAVAEEHGIALKELGIAPISNMSGMIKLGCRDVLKIAARRSPTRSVRQNGNLFRKYEYRGLDLTTETDQATVVFAASLPASAFGAWGLTTPNAPSGVSLADLEQRFGPSKADGSAKAMFSAPDDDRAILFVHLDDQQITQLEWSCD